MRFAFVNEVRCEASPGLIGVCPGCHAALIAKCGTKRIWHWAHRGQRSCDPWWESESEWHRAWKNLFPSDCQEIQHRDANGERHVADIKTTPGLIIEIQHSPITDAEMNAREAFYKDMVWVADATRLKRDALRFNKGAANCLTSIGGGYYITGRPDECFHQSWLNRSVPVLFDFEALNGFQNGKPVERSQLWCLLPGRVSGRAVIALVSRRQFAEIAMQRKNVFPTEQIMQTIREALSPPRNPTPPRPPFPPPWQRRRRYARF